MECLDLVRSLEGLTEQDSDGEDEGMGDKSLVRAASSAVGKTEISPTTSLSGASSNGGALPNLRTSAIRRSSRVRM